jgi:hypothetical protein
MSDFTQAEILNEVSKIFRAQIDPGREGGTLNTATEYEQLLELSSITFLLHNDAIFYLAFIARNYLYSLLTSEVAVLEDMLVALEDLSQLGSPVRDITTLSNADTALLALDASSSVTNRPETQRFSGLMDTFAAQLHPNVVSRMTRSLVRPREDARNVLKTDLAQVKILHDQLISLTFSLRDLMGNFVALDIPSKVAATTISSIRGNLDVLSTSITTDDAATNVAKSRQNLLTVLASKVAMNSLSQFTDPRDLKIRTPIEPIPSSIKHLGRVSGVGSPPSIISGPGPWVLPISEPIELTVNGSSYLTINVDTILGATLNGRASENFYPTPDKQHLHVIVDPEVRTNVLDASTDLTTAIFTEFMPLGFKHLGSPISFPGAYVNPSGEPFFRNLNPRIISEHRSLQGFTVVAFNALTNMITLSTPTAGDEPGAGLRTDHVGTYLKQTITGSTYRWEILEVLPPLGPTFWYAIISIPDNVIPITPDVGASCELRGQTSVAGGTKITYSMPQVTTAPVGNAVIGPAVKTVRFDTPGPKTLNNLLTNIKANQGSYDTFYTGDVSQALNQHVKASAVAGNPGHLALTIRSKQNPYIKVSDSFLQVSNAAIQPNPPVAAYIKDSSHPVLGLILAESDTTNVLSPSELASWINASSGEIAAEVVTTELWKGDNLSLLVPNSPAEVVDPSVDFSGVARVGDQIEIVSPDATVTGVYQITAISNSQLTLNRAGFSGASTVSYRLFREQVKISTVRSDRGSSLEMTSGPAELGFATGAHYGALPSFEAVDKSGNLWDFSAVSPGDVLRIIGSSLSTTVVSSSSTKLTVDPGLPSNIENVGFEVRSGSSTAYTAMQALLQTFTTSSVLLVKNHYDENLDVLDSSLTTALLPGQNFASSRNRARQAVADLISILSTTLQRSDEYTVEIPTAPLTLESILSPFVIPEVAALDSLLDAFLDRKYDRSVNLLKSAQITEFYSTNEETGSYSGAVISSSRTVIADLPKAPSAAHYVENQLNIATKFRTVTST